MSDTLAATLLRWYDRNARTLPWRSANPDPYRVWLSEIMLQQTTTTAVAPYYARFLERWPNVEALAAAADTDVMGAWAGLGYYARARNLLACARDVVGRHGGRFPATEDALRTLPGVGAYTAAAVAAIAFGQRAVVVDGNVERVVSRLFAIETPLPASRPAIRARADAITPQTRAGDFAQAMMDVGATICTPKTPACMLCPLAGACLAREHGVQATLPRRAAKADRPYRVGAVFVGTRRDGAVLLRTRPPLGLLGGMSEFPGSWPLEPGHPRVDPPVSGMWREVGRAYHGFTHFDLELAVSHAALDIDSVEPPLRWVSSSELKREALPSLMRKVASVAGVNAAATVSALGGPEQAQGPSSGPTRRRRERQTKPSRPALTDPG